jgi:hypothetical protein
MMRSFMLDFFGKESSQFQKKWMLSILGSRFKVNTSNGIHDFTLFKILKNVHILTSYKPLDASISNLDLLFKIDSIHFIK